MKYVNIILNFLKNYYDKIILGILLIVLAAILVVQTDNLKKTQEKVNKADQDLQRKLPTAELEPIDESQYNLKIAVDSERVWQETSGPLTLVDPGNYVYAIDGSPYLLGADTRVNPYTGKPDLIGGGGTASKISADKSASRGTDSGDSDRDGIPDSIEDASGLDKKNPTDALLDKDGDGFDNREEYDEKTGIADDDSFPRLVTRARFLKKTRRKLAISLKNVNMNNEPDDKTQWDIEIKYKSKGRLKTDFLKIGDEIPESGYKIVDAAYKETIENRIPKNVSEIKVTKDSSDEPITLVRNTTAYEGEGSFELFYYMGKPTKIKVDFNSPFSLANLKNKKETYKIVDENEVELTAELVGSNERFVIKKFSSEDKKRFFKE